jgi:PRC-barrel domain
MQERQTPLYPTTADVPLERDLRQNLRRPAPSGPRTWEQEDDRVKNSEVQILGVLSAVLGAGALLAWYGSTRRSHSRSAGRGHKEHRSSELATDETDELIASNKVEGTAVYDRNGEKIGTVHNFMVGKRSGRVAYAVLSFGGFLGLGGGYHPLPWNALTYDTSKSGYVLKIDKERLRNAPQHQTGEDLFLDSAFSRRVRDYWLIVE